MAGGMMEETGGTIQLKLSAQIRWRRFARLWSASRASLSVKNRDRTRSLRSWPAQRADAIF
jgi:hypothetical protein